MGSESYTARAAEGRWIGEGDDVMHSETYEASRPEREMPDREPEGVDVAADVLRTSVEKLGAHINELRKRLHPVMREEIADCVAADRLHAVRPTSSALTTHLAETVDLVGSLQRQVADLLARLDLSDR